MSTDDYERLKATWGDVFPPTGADWVECLNNKLGLGQHTVTFRRSDVLAFSQDLLNGRDDYAHWGAVEVVLARGGVERVVSLKLRRHHALPESIFRMVVEGHDLPHALDPYAPLPRFYDAHVRAHREQSWRGR